MRTDYYIYHVKEENKGGFIRENMKCSHTLNYEIGMVIGDGVVCITLYDAFIYCEHEYTISKYFFSREYTVFL